MNSHEADDLQQDLIRDLRDVDEEIHRTTKRIDEEREWLKKQFARRDEMVTKLRHSV